MPFAGFKPAGAPNALLLTLFRPIFIMHHKPATDIVIRQAASKDDFLNCWNVVQALRPHLNLDRYLVLILYMMDEGYRMIYIEEEGKAVAICGYRYETMLHRGRSVYVDDLCTLPEARGRGYATALLHYVQQKGRGADCASIHLDSGHHRYDAHRLYFREGFRISAHHFMKEIQEPQG